MSSPPSQPPGSWVEQWLSGPRFGVYLAAAGADPERALRLYEWNTLASAAVHHDLAHLEVALRNGYDTAIVTHTQPPGSAHWTLSPHRLFPTKWRTARDGTRIDNNRMPRDQIAKAVQAAGGRHAPTGKVIAELTFGFWRYLTTRSHHTRLWVPYLHHAFVPGTARADIDDPVGRLHKLRNRVAHHEPLLNENLPDRHQDVLAVARRLSVDLEAHLRATSQVLHLNSARP